VVSIISFPNKLSRKESATQQLRRGQLTILVVEDHNSLQDMVSVYLGWYGYRVRNASSGEEALKILGREKVHVMLLDLMLPRVSGFEMLRILKEENKRGPLPYIIVVSAMDPHDTKSKVLALGANEFMCKPFTLSALLDHIEELSPRLL